MRRSRSNADRGRAEEELGDEWEAKFRKLNPDHDISGMVPPLMLALSRANLRATLISKRNTGFYKIEGTDPVQITISLREEGYRVARAVAGKWRVLGTYKRTGSVVRAIKDWI